MIMSNLGGEKICGKRGSKPFTQALRPISDGFCPEKTVPCSNITSLENTVCISIEDKETGLCPITEVKIMISA